MRLLKYVLLCMFIGVPFVAAGGEYLDHNLSLPEAALAHMNANGRAQGGFQYDLFRAIQDDIGQAHVRFTPKLNGLKVYGHQVIMHVDAFSREILDVQGNLKDSVDNGSNSPSGNYFGSNVNLDPVMQNLGAETWQSISRPKLAYVVTREKKVVKVWTVRVKYFSQELGDQLDRFFFSASDGQLVARHPEYHYARSRRTYTANNGTSLPGSLVRSETSGASGDSCVDDAHDFAGYTYDFYNTFFNRDSLNDSGMTLISTAHYDSNYNNAFWDGSQMVYGDGDGSTFTCLSGDLDVVGHELSHGVTEYTANLTYSYESGALNEATSDIMGASIEAWVEGGVNSNTWKLGEDIYTPGTPGDALRYMDDPTIDGQSSDYYPDRYTGSQDNGGVHLNSGIANLFYVLLTQGGTHPQGKTSTVVTGIGIDEAAAIWYRALTVYMGPSTQFADARENTIAAAEDLFGVGSQEATQVGNAWTAVGVNGPAPTVEITNGQTVSGLSASTGEFLYYKINIPAGATNFVATISGGSGDADLYTQYNTKPTTTSYICRPYVSGNSETCTVASPSAGYYYIGIRAYSSFSSVSLTASYSGGSGNSAPTAGFTYSTNYLSVNFTDTSSDSDGTIASRSWNFGDGGTSSTTNPSHSYTSAGTYNVTLTVTDNDGATDSYSTNVTVSAQPSNTPPTANFTFSATDLTVNFTDTSSDSDGTIASRSWSFGDGGTSTAQNPSHTYGADGTYSVTLTVTDNDGATNSKSANVTVSATVPPGDGELVNGQTVTGLAATSGNWNYFFISVPDGATNLLFSMSGGSGDADLYTRFGAQPTTSAYDCRPYAVGNSETCSVATPTAGDYYIGIRAYSSYSNVTFTVTYTEPGTGGGGGSGDWTVVSSTSFENGWDGYASGGSDCRLSSSDSYYAHTGTYCVRIRDNSGAASAFSNTLNLSGYSELSFDFYFIANSMETGEDFFVEVYTNSGWQAVANYARGYDFNNGTMYQVQFTIDTSQYGFNIANGGVRFRCDASSNSDYVYIDDVIISAR